MKTFLIYFFSCLSIIAFSQSSNVNGKIVSVEDKLPVAGLEIQLINNDLVTQVSYTDIDGNFNLKNIPTGNYDLKMSLLGFRDKKVKLKINTESINLDFVYPDPYPKTAKICPQGHTKEIIPIVYGYPNKTTTKKSEKEKLKLGGCNTSQCENWHCKIHNLDF